MQQRHIPKSARVCGGNITHQFALDVQSKEALEAVCGNGVLRAWRVGGDESHEVNIDLTHRQCTGNYSDYTRSVTLTCTTFD